MRRRKVTKTDGKAVHSTALWSYLLTLIPHWESKHCRVSAGFTPWLQEEKGLSTHENECELVLAALSSSFLVPTSSIVFTLATVYRCFFL